jgi:hypothetical protein
LALAQTKAKKCSPGSSGASRGRFRQDRCGSELPFLKRLVDAGERSRHMVLTDGEGLILFVCAVSKNVTECSRDRILALYVRVPPAHVDVGGAEIVYDEFVHLLRGTIVSYELELPQPWGTRLGLPAVPYNTAVRPVLYGSRNRTVRPKISCLYGRTLYGPKPYPTCQIRQKTAVDGSYGSCDDRMAVTRAVGC